MVEDGLRDENKSSGERAPFFLPPSLLIGVTEIDQEHQHLIEIINRAGSSASHQQHLQEIVSALADHFANEEETMRQAGYPRLREHAEHHKAVLARMQDIASRAAERHPVHAARRHPARGSAFQVLPPGQGTGRGVTLPDRELIQHLPDPG
jgi:hemerythrin-like metal-binding protein